MVGAVRFELTTSCTRSKRASQTTLRPDTGRRRLPAGGGKCNVLFIILAKLQPSRTAICPLPSIGCRQNELVGGPART